MSEKNNFSGVVESLMKNVNGFVSTKTVVGEVTKIEDTMILPLVDVSFALGAGAFVGDKKDNGGGIVSGKMTPSAILVIQNGSAKLVNVKNQDSMTKILDMVPDVINKFTASKDITVSDEAVKNTVKETVSETASETAYIKEETVIE